MGGGTKTVTNNSPWTPAQPYILGGLQNDQQVLNNNQGGLQSLASGLTSNVIPGIQKQIGQDGQNLQPGFNYIGNTLSPGFLQNGQAQAQALGNFAGQQAGNQINSAFSAAGRTGSGNNITDTARGVTQAELAPMLQNYQYNEGIQNSALSQLPGMTAAGYSGYTPLLAANQEAGQLPYYGIQSYANALGALSGNYGTQTQQQSGGLLNNLLGAGAMLGSAAIMHSDRRSKRDIIKVGEFKDGLGIYEFNYREGLGLPSNRFRGVMADEVEKLRPRAFVPNYRGSGFDAVNYGALGSVA